ncbi:riboflavin synthase, alpha subunit [Thermoanaerobacterium thermosaccharolyticum DSM 571]|uniref:Riboflavin synthase n=1 Tax=Thermoanaerobacterium thermosaccharolyticum (strain ATCC 7956 / DSM 571 / NCIMB 9385 / NCA 3814 / NCTC 13789 / WDCM 00135 / 2032) TaxID=580327 RepID=D9TMU1_THETC|nr:riboflavin synthase [Thermoanaerobacterium thermosaccharolyticum]ADL67619.1 riboflavin synthase, alpha subunit [Thermoanaerobacterium thermosaccharolyticum DSM 571]
MFTGIIEEIGKVKMIQRGDITKIAIECDKVLNGTRIGDSIAVNGVCLTVTNVGKNLFTADLMRETLKSSNLGNLKIGSMVNLERALSISGRLNGHIVTGHVDTVGTIVNKNRIMNSNVFKIKIDERYSKYVVSKGSIAVDGISLTVVEALASYFTVSVIPHTELNTTLNFKRIGDSVNIEVDILSKYAEKLLLKKGMKELVLENGF